MLSTPPGNAPMPIGLTLGGLQFLIVDQAVPRVTPALVDWGIGDYGKKKLAVGGETIYELSYTEAGKTTRVSYKPDGTFLRAE